MLSLASCAPQPPLPPDPVCPLPVKPTCHPEAFAGRGLYDTTSSGIALDYYEIVRLDTPANSRDNEIGAGFFRDDGAPVALVTSDRSSDRGKQRVFPMPVSSFKRFDSVGVLQGLTMNGGGCSVDQRTMHVYFGAPRSKGSFGDYDIYEGRLERTGEHWSIADITPLSDSVNAANSWDAQPAISPDGATLYFSSDRPGGLGGTDLWCSRKQPDGAWGAAQNLGPEINTTCEEVTPFVSVDGQWLYFSSSGRQSVGGYDLWRAPIANDTPHAPVNLGPPVNTAADEIFPSSFVSGDSLLYYCSTQPGSMGGFDLYVIRRVIPTPRPRVEQPIERPPQLVQVPPEPVQPVQLEMAAPDSLIMLGKVIDARTRAPINDASVTWRVLPNRSLTGQVRTGMDGRYRFPLQRRWDYEVSAQAVRYFYDAVQFTAPAADSVHEFIHDFALPETLALRVNFPFDLADRPYDKTLNDSGRPGDLSVDEAIDLLVDNLRKYEAKITRIRLIGHTDSSGTDTYNERLGLRRAQFVKNQLVKRGLSADFMSVESRGRREPLQRRPGESDETYAARLRRTELAKEMKR